jgi:hypothetical protein
MDLADDDQIIKSLVGIAARMDIALRRQEEHNADLKAILQQHVAVNAQQTAVNAQQAVVNTQNTTLIMRIVRTLDRIDEKLDRIFPPTA